VVRGRPTPGRRPPTLFITVAVLATAAALFALVIANVLLGQAGFAQVELERRVASEQAQLEELQLEVAHLRSPARIAKAARRMGLVPGSSVTFLSPVGGPSPKRGRP
jgi:cell division protein FtsL